MISRAHRRRAWAHLFARFCWPTKSKRRKKKKRKRLSRFHRARERMKRLSHDVIIWVDLSRRMSPLEKLRSSACFFSFFFLPRTAGTTSARLRGAEKGMLT